MENFLFLWLVTTDENATRDIEEVFTTRESAERYAQNEIKRCDWEVLEYKKNDAVTKWTIKSKYEIIFTLIVSAIPFNNF